MIAMSKHLIGINSYSTPSEADAVLCLLNPTSGSTAYVGAHLFQRVNNLQTVEAILDEVIDMGYIPYSINIKSRGHYDVANVKPRYFEKFVSPRMKV